MAAILHAFGKGKEALVRLFPQREKRPNVRKEHIPSVAGEGKVPYEAEIERILRFAQSGNLPPYEFQMYVRMITHLLGGTTTFIFSEVITKSNPLTVNNATITFGTHFDQTRKIHSANISVQHNNAILPEGNKDALAALPQPFVEESLRFGQTEPFPLVSFQLHDLAFHGEFPTAIQSTLLGTEVPIHRYAENTSGYIQNGMQIGSPGQVVKVCKDIFKGYKKLASEPTP